MFGMKRGFACTMLAGLLSLSTSCSSSTDPTESKTVDTSDGADNQLGENDGDIDDREEKNQPPSIVRAIIALGTYRTDATIQVMPEGWSDKEGASPTYKYQWLVDGNIVPGETTDTLEGSRFDKGEFVSAKVTPNDGSQDGEPVLSNSVTIANTPPTLDTVSLVPLSLTTLDNLIATPGTTFDEDGDGVAVKYIWHQNGMVNGLITTGTFDAAEHQRGDIIYVEAVPFDGQQDGMAVASTTVTIGNAPPYVSAVNFGIFWSPYSDDVLTAYEQFPEDPDGDAVDFDYSWRVNGLPVAATGATLDGAVFFSRGDTVTVTLYPVDFLGDYGPPVTSDPVTIVNKLPQFTGATLGNGPYHTNDTITASGLGWYDADDDPERYEYVWYKNYTWIVISGVTGPTLADSNFVKGDRIWVRMTPKDDFGSGTSFDAPELTIANSMPSMTAVTVAADPYYNGQDIVAYPQGFNDADGDSPYYRYAWYVNGVSSPGSQTLNANYTSRGDNVYVVAWPRDGNFGAFAEGLPVTSATVTVINSPPGVSSVSLGAGPYYTNDLLTASPSGWSDADNDTADYVYAWTVNGVSVPGATDNTLDGAMAFSRSDTVKVVVVPFDGFEYGDAVSDDVAIQNSIPPDPYLLLYPGSPTTGSTLFTAVTSAAEADGDPLSFLYAWYLNDSVQAFPSSQTSVAPPLAKGDHWRVTVQSYDGLAYGAIDSQSVVVPFQAAQVDAGGFETCAVTTEGRVFCWGDNYFGQLGIGVTGGYEVAFQEVTGFPSAVSNVAVGEFHACAVTDAGGVYCWGRNNYGQLGTGTTTPSNFPVLVSGLASGVTAVTVGLGHTCAVLSDGGVKCWGKNFYGQVGDGTGNNYRVFPVTLSGLGGPVRQISAGDEFTCAVLTWGEVQCWGLNTVGQLGNGGATTGGCTSSQACYTSPDYVDDYGDNLTDSVEVAAGGMHGCVVNDYSNVICWGYNNTGQLGRYTADDIQEQPLFTEAGYTSISAGGAHSCGLTTGGGVKCWGSNTAYQIGADATTCNMSPCALYPTQVEDLTGGVAALSADAGGHTCVLLADRNQLRCWGRNNYGQLGDGTSGTNRKVPVKSIGFGGQYP